MSSAMTRRHRIYHKRIKNGEVIHCGLCGEPITLNLRRSQCISHGGKGGLSVGHIIERSKGGADAYANFQPAHGRCNNEKSNGKNVF